METIHTILTVIQVILAVGVVVLVLLQQSKSAGLSGAIAGGAETFFGKNKGRSAEGLLRRLTIIGASVLALTTLLLTLLH